MDNVDMQDIPEIPIQLSSVETCFLIQLLLIDHDTAMEAHADLTAPAEICESQRMLDMIETISSKLNACLFDCAEVAHQLQVAKVQGGVH
jgi:hypothetical protein